MPSIWIDNPFAQGSPYGRFFTADGGFALDDVAHSAAVTGKATYSVDDGTGVLTEKVIGAINVSLPGRRCWRMDFDLPDSKVVCRVDVEITESVILTKAQASVEGIQIGPDKDILPPEPPPGEAPPNLLTISAVGLDNPRDVLVVGRYRGPAHSSVVCEYLFRDSPTRLETRAVKTATPVIGHGWVVDLPIKAADRDYAIVQALLVGADSMVLKAARKKPV